jgi:NAD(P)-dependent dehydrogenase (short-subunit alcohol dehydrogenase family)
LENLQNVAKDCGGDDKVLVLQADVTNEDDVKKIIDETIKKFSRLDVL